MKGEGEAKAVGERPGDHGDDGHSRPLIHHGRVVTRLFAIPTPKWARMLRPAAQSTAGVPRVKKKGVTGMIPPTAVETVADRQAFQGLGRSSPKAPTPPAPAS